MWLTTKSTARGAARSFHTSRVAISTPIDAILLDNMRKASDVLSTHKSTWRNVKWTALREDEYYRLIDQLRMCIHGEPFWTIERFWTVTDQED